MSEHKFVLVSDNCADLPYSFYTENNIPIVTLSYTMDNITYSDISKFLSPKEFYAKVRAGSAPITHQANPGVFIDVFKKLLDAGSDILYVGFSSGLSGTFQSAVMAKDELMQEYPDRKIELVDSLCASAGQGLLLNMALDMRNDGQSLQHTKDLLEQNKMFIVHDVVLSDLFHLQRGGRISKASAMIGSALGIKPTIYVNSQGKLVPSGKVRGLKLAFSKMLERMRANFVGSISPKIFISHSDSYAQAEELFNLIRDAFPEACVQIYDVGPVIGSHTGAGTIALFYFSKTREVSDT